ncbi:MAG: gluconate 2-dehydrogenase subunit 3 family protein [Bryobacteraceae bacterium]
MRRRDWLAVAGASYLTGVLDLEAAQHVHKAAAAAARKSGGPYQPKFFREHEYKALGILADLIVPADETSKGALDARAPEFIDLLSSQNEELAQIYAGGLAWLDTAMRHRFSASFADAKNEQRIQMLDLIAYRKNNSPELGPGIQFFSWARKMVVDAYYTHPVGIAQIGYMGNTGMTTFQVPAAAIEYAIKRSPFQ